MDTLELGQDVLGCHTFWQPREGYRFSMDSVLLAAFAPQARGLVADLCAGCGVLSVLLHARDFLGPFTAVELDHDLAECCERNFEAAGLDGVVLRHDLQEPLAAELAGRFKLVISNPPFFAPGTGRVPAMAGRARARHGLDINTEDLFAGAARLLPVGGRMVLCWPPARLVEALAALTHARLTPKRLRLVHGRQGRPASLALIEAAKDRGPQLTVEPPLICYGQGRDYSPEVAAIYRDLGCS